MAKGKKNQNMVVKLVSMAGTGFFYTTTKNPAATRKLFLQKYDPMLGSHTLFREERISRSKRK
ncbi:ribosomal protein L33, putative [Acanthamoeba castellanii str. Neff]|uniref:Ribosomal protein L33, putative n=1 Tax=Acanthamoeba castellanii (strain ATCC 30010 / Neff) TaxID=1257118 RepID=L8GJX1_ACACF|nr:ribosomal protein L33, putative [Acanthamoeba castellanii str. Neff]ELR13099.1 ribosomal protein L33, putative [Acanthamoeba castellanii str. Neff]